MKQSDNHNRLLLPQTGQSTCHDGDGRQICCADSGQDGELRSGQPWPEPRFEDHGDMVRDRLTHLIWTKSGNLAGFPLDWQESLDFVADMNRARHFGFNDWRMPNRRELRSLISHQTRIPALPDGHPFTDVFAVVSDLRRASGHAGWRLPNINDLESLVDCNWNA